MGRLFSVYFWVASTLFFYGLFYDAASTSDHMMSTINSLVNGELEECGIKSSWPTLGATPAFACAV
jgi:hypothetical protein